MRALCARNTSGFEFLAEIIQFRVLKHKWAQRHRTNAQKLGLGVAIPAGSLFAQQAFELAIAWRWEGLPKDTSACFNPLKMLLP